MIKVSDLAFAYKKQKPLFTGLDLDEKPGSIIGLLGKNGAGKSTFLKLISGLISPQKGELFVFGRVPIKRSPDFLSNIFMVPEEFNLPACTIEQYVNATAKLYPQFSYDKFDDIIAEFELDKASKIQKMSYGQRKKFFIAFALSTRCKLLLLDEPTNGLDIPSKSLFRKVVAGALTDDQLVIISTHQVKDVENLIDRIILLDNGNVLFNADLMDIADNYTFYNTTSVEKGDYLYYEPIPGGYKAIKKDKGNTDIDMEILFNAIINGKIES